MVLSVGPTTLRLVKGSVLDQPVDAIVNAANTRMRGGGGIDGAIHQAAGANLLLELQRVAPKGSKTGEVVATSGHDLRQRHILHVAGPIWHGGNQGEEGLLRSTYRNVLEKARELEVSSVAFPSISTGSFGYPIELAAPVAFEAIFSWLSGTEHSLEEVTLAMFGSREYGVYRTLFGDT